MSENAPKITEAKKRLPVYVDKDGNVFKFGVLKHGLKGDYETQAIISGEEDEDQEPFIQEDVVEDEPKKANDYDSIIYNLSQQIKDLTDKINSVGTQQPSVAPQVIAQEKEKEFGEGVRNIPPDDFDKKGATFVSYGMGRLVSVYMKDGAEHLAPYRKSCEFRYESSDIRRSGKEEHIIHFCKYSTKSKKEIAFLRNHPEYNRTIFENAHKAANTDPEMITKVSAAISMIENLRQDALFARANSLGIDVSQGYDKVKQQMIALTYNDLKNQELSLAEKRMNDSAEAIGLFSPERAEE